MIDSKKIIFSFLRTGHTRANAEQNGATCMKTVFFADGMIRLRDPCPRKGNYVKEKTDRNDGHRKRSDPIPID
jgi:hypothetical protein